jgi:hypothetical protein
MADYYDISIAHAQSIVMTVKEIEEGDKKVTMLQLVDLWKSQTQKAGIKE